jgi:glycosyltransferase involved in cell wall biosynthesis
MAIWLDVTTILQWRRPATGVVRVEAELFRHLMAEPGIRFCSFDRASGQYSERAAGEVLATLERNALGTDAPPADTLTRRLVKGADQLLRGAPLPVFKLLSRLKKASSPVLRGTLHQWREKANAMKAARQAQRAAASASAARGTGPVALFARGDVLISAGLDWDLKDFTALYRLKRAHELRVVLVCYDLIPVLLPHLCRSEVADVFPGYYADVAWVADRVLCISESSERDFTKYVQEIGAPLPQTSLLRLGSVFAAPASLPAIEHLVQGPFVLFVSTLERRKNHEILYRALVRLFEQGRAAVPTLVFVGMPGWGVEGLLGDLQRDPRVRGRVVQLPHVTDGQLSALYAKARFTVFPSLYEGWGLPIAESLAHGRFCLAADGSSLREVGGELIEYLDPWDVEAWAERLAHYTEHPEEVALREAEIARRFVPTPWSETARTVLEAARRQG